MAMRRIFRARWVDDDDDDDWRRASRRCGVKVVIWRISDGRWGLRCACDAARGAKRGGARGGWMMRSRGDGETARARIKRDGRRLGARVCVCVVLVD